VFSFSPGSSTRTTGNHAYHVRNGVLEGKTFLRRLDHGCIGTEDNAVLATLSCRGLIWRGLSRSIPVKHCRPLKVSRMYSVSQCRGLRGVCRRNSPSASKRFEVRCQLVILVVPNDLAFLYIRKTLIPLLVFTADYERYGQNPSPCQRSGVELKKEAVQPGTV
jgi:hypothetical protein